MEKYAEMFFKSRKTQKKLILELGCPTTFSARIVEDTGDAFVTLISIRIYVCTCFQKIIIKSRESIRRLQVILQQQSESEDA